MRASILKNKLINIYAVKVLFGRALALLKTEVKYRSSEDFSLCNFSTGIQGK